MEQYRTASKIASQRIHTCYSENIEKYPRFIARGNRCSSYTLYLEGEVVVLDEAITIVHETKEGLARLSLLKLPETPFLPPKFHPNLNEEVIKSLESALT